MKALVSRTIKIILGVECLSINTPFVVAEEPLAYETADTTSIALTEVSVTAPLIRHSLKSDVYLATVAMKQGIGSVYEMLAKIPGITYDPLQANVKVRFNDNVLILVDGRSVSNEYLQALPLDCIAKVEVINQPSARYAAQGYQYVIDIRIKNDYEGQELYIGNFTIASLGNNNGDNLIANEQPKAQYIYAGENLDLTAGYGFGDIHWNYPESYTRKYIGIGGITTQNISAKNPNDHNFTLGHIANLGLDWHLTNTQSISLRSAFQANSDHHQTSYNTNMEDYDGRLVEQSTSLNKDYSKAHDIYNSLIYRGQLANSLNLYSAFAFTYRRDKEACAFSSDYFIESNSFINKKRQYKYELDISYDVNECISANVGYLGAWDRYSTKQLDKLDVLSKDNESRSIGYVFIDWFPFSSFLFHVGTNLEFDYKSNNQISKHWTKFLPQISLSWLPSENVQLLAMYAIKMNYPGMYQLSQGVVTVDQWQYSIGNISLLPSGNHAVSLQATIGDFFIIGTEYAHTNNAIIPWYDELKGKACVSTYTNANTDAFKAIFSYDWKISSNLTWKNIGQWSWQRVSGLGHSNHQSNLAWHSGIEYWNKNLSTLINLEYVKEMGKIPLLQGYSNFGQDYWQLGAQRQFFNKSLSVSLNYILPIHWGVHTKQISQIDTPFYQGYEQLGLKTYDNTLMLRISYRFNKGRNKQRRNPHYEFDEERKADRGIL